MTANHHGFPAGWVSPESWDHAQRKALEWQLAQEEEAAAKAAREQALADRIASIRGGADEPVAVPEKPRVVAIVGDDAKGEVSK